MTEDHITRADSQSDADFRRAQQCFGSGKVDEAELVLQGILARDPDHFEASEGLAVLYATQGNLDAAIPMFQKAAGLRPNKAGAHFNLGTALTEVGRLEEAISAFLQCLRIDPNGEPPHINLGNAYKETGDLDAAAASFRRAIEINPASLVAHNNLGSTLRLLGDAPAAITCFEKVLNLAPNLPGSPDTSQAVMLDIAEVHYNLGLALQDQGKLDHAVANFHKALATRPDFAEAHYHLVRMKKHSEHNSDIQAMEQLHAQPAISSEQRKFLAFGLGKAFEDLQQYEKAFDYFAEGNAIKRGSYSYSVDSHGRFTKKLEAVFDSALFTKHPGTGCRDETAIFILGMPRSGTTLVEQILASHPDVHGAGELETLSQIVNAHFGDKAGIEFPETVQQTDGVDFERPGLNYIEAIRKHSGEARFITDKMPENFKYIGLIKLMLPNAKVIHCRREPADTCLSIFKTNFLEKHEYSHDLSDLAHYYNFYSDLMEHWRRVIPDFIHDVQYEDIIADQTGQTRALLEYCGLEWDEACLAFYKSDRLVVTASSEQVRRPIYKDSIQLWKRYEAQLAPMLEILR